MAGLHHSIISAFAVNKVLREKGQYKTTDGTRLIRKTKDQREQILARYQIINHCIKSGFSFLDNYHLSLDGQPYVVYENDCYIMTDIILYPEADFTADEDFFRTVTALASFHKAARGLSFNSDAILHKGRPALPLTDLMKEQLKALDINRKRLRKQSKMSDFDVLFVKHFSDYRERIKRALLLLESTGYSKHLAKAKQNNHICHGAIKEDCVKMSDELVYITNLDNVSVGYQLSDLCNLISRRERRAPVSTAKVVEIYSQILPLEPEEEVILEAMLLYPSAFIKICTEYYQKKRSWTPIAMINKMQEIVEPS